MKITAFDVGSAVAEGDRLLERFVALRDREYEGDYYHYPEGDQEATLIRAYAARADYRLRLVLAEENGRDIARVLVGRAAQLPFSFFGFFEGPDDAATFRLLLARALDEARSFGAREIRGPLSLNALHGWEFLTRKELPERWFGDPYHKPYHPRLFYDAGFTDAETGLSGIGRPELHALMRALERPAMRAMRDLGVTLRRKCDVDLERDLPKFHRLTEESFNVEEHGYMSIPYPLFHASLSTLLGLLDDDNCLLSLWKGDDVVGYFLSYPNPIERLCNPRGAKERPPWEPVQRYFGIKSICVGRELRGKTDAFKALMGVAVRASERYGSRFMWRRANVNNRSIAVAKDQSDITHEYKLLSIAL